MNAILKLPADSRHATVHDAVRSGFVEVLGIDEPDEHDDFFELGGDSLMALSLFLHIEERGLSQAHRAAAERRRPCPRHQPG